MHILFDGIIYSLQRHGGITVYFNELLQRSTTHKVSCHTVVYEGASEHADALLGHTERRKYRLGERFRQCFVPTDIDLFHSSYYRLPSRPVTTVTTVHDFTHERFVNPPRRWLHSWQKFDAIRKSQAIICISENTRADLFYFLPDIPPERVHVIYNGVGDAFFPLMDKIDETDKDSFALFVGARGGYKNFKLTVEALSCLQELGLVCVGGGPLSVEETHHANRHLGDRFKHFPSISEKALNKLYNLAYCLVYPSVYEGFGIPVLEAMRAGCPVVAFNGSSIPEVAGDSALLFNQATTDALIDSLEKLKCRRLRTALRKKGFENSKIFSWEKTFEETLRVYDSVL